MKYDLYKPCSNCPFLKKGGIRLRQERVRDISSAMTDDQGSTFACHKTTIDDGDMELCASKDSRHCAGALIYAEKQGKCNQMTRIMERLGAYDSKRMMANKEVVDSVFGSLREMLIANRRGS